MTMSPSTSLIGKLCCFPWLRRHGRRGSTAPPVTTITELHRILSNSGASEPLPHANAVDEVYPGIFIGDEQIVSNTLGLKLLRITHVLNCAHGRGHRHVNTSDRTYAKKGIIFMGVPADDVPDFNMLPFFQEAADFIHTALSSGKGRVLVHCKVGLSRSPTIVIAYLMMHKQMTLTSAVECVHGKRPQIWPNDGFLLQLICLEEELKKIAASRGLLSSIRRKPKVLFCGSLCSASEQQQDGTRPAQRADGCKSRAKSSR